MGGAFGWGLNNYGQLGNGSTANQPTPDFAGGIPQCWGNGEYGHVGDGTGLTRMVPSTVGGGTLVMTSISSGAFSEHTCGISTALDLYCWGINNAGELGDGTNYSAYSPTKSILQ